MNQTAPRNPEGTPSTMYESLAERARKCETTTIEFLGEVWLVAKVAMVVAVLAVLVCLVCLVLSVTTSVGSVGALFFGVIAFFAIGVAMIMAVIMTLIMTVMTAVEAVTRQRFIGKLRPDSIIRHGKSAGWIMPGRGQQFYDLSYGELIEEYVKAGRKCRTPGQRKWRQFAFSCRVIVLWLECLARAIFHSPLTRLAFCLEAVRRFLS